jgi:CDP-paratose 2-epimerase
VIQQLGANFQHAELDIRARPGVLTLLAELKSTAIVHTAAQPSTYAVGTLNLPEATLQSCPESPFVHLSTNKV